MFSAGYMIAASIINRVPNQINEFFQNKHRSALANNFLEQWGQDFMNELVDPRCPVSTIKHLKNPLGHAH